jgi:FKBP-type peptidyl-prolyl cis-trans isomerase FkpA/FKBP-type peptidyl-prolyl cis-trans isomerase FklB
VSDDFLTQNATNDDVVVLDSGLQYKVEVAGEGAQPGSTDQVLVHYEGRLVDGTVFDSSYQRGAPISFGLNQVIPGWTEGLQHMREGGKHELYIPYQLAYGEAGIPGTIPAKATLIFTVELLQVK